MLSIACLLTVGAFGQDPPTIPNPAPRAMHVGRNDQAQLSLSFEYVGKTTESSLFNKLTHLGHCSNDCQGKVHQTHVQCDLSCDLKCGTNHRVTQGPRLISEIHWESSSIVRGALQDMINQSVDLGPDSPHAVDFVANHWNLAPCSFARGVLQFHRFDIKMKQITRTAKFDDRGVMSWGDPYERITTVAKLFLPTREVTSDYHQESCFCRYRSTLSPYGYEPTPPANDDSRSAYTPGPSYGSTGYGAPLGDSGAKAIGLTARLVDMGNGTLSARNALGVDWDLFVPAGTLLDSDDDGYQDEVTVVDVLMNFSVVFAASTQGGSAPEVTAPLRVMCLEIKKKEPNPKVKYKILPARDRLLTAICRQINDTRFRGPWDQAKIWLYTDGATYADIEKRLIPPPSRRQYVAAMRQLAEVGVPLWTKKYAKCFDPGLLAGPLDEEDLEFLVPTLTGDRKAVLAWAKGPGRAAVQEAISSSRDENRAYVGMLVRHLAMSGATDLRMAAIALLAAVPAAKRSTISDDDLAYVWALALTKDKAVAQSALSLMDSFSPETKSWINKPVQFP